MNNNTILAIVFLMAGTLLTSAVASVPYKTAYATDDDDGNKNKAEEESVAAIADCDDNDVDGSDFDCFGIAGNDIEIEEENGISLIEVGCPDGTVWDITILGPAEEGGVPVGTVICLIQGLGNQPTVVILPGGERFETNVNTNQPNQANCNAPGQQVAQVTSGIPPNPLGPGGVLCATVDLP
jgi:hypothetical protein